MPDPTSRPKAELAAAALKAPLESAEAPAPAEAAPEPAVTEYFVPNFVANADLLALRPTPKPQAAVASAPPPPKPTPEPTLPPVPQATPAPTTTPTPTPPPPSGSGPTEQHWAKLRYCESSNNYSVISEPNSQGIRYYGAYQFNISTWDLVAGGNGRPDLVGVLPSDAAGADQDAMAQALYAERKWQPWPPATDMYARYGGGIWEYCPWDPRF